MKLFERCWLGGVLVVLFGGFGSPFLLAQEESAEPAQEAVAGETSEGAESASESEAQPAWNEQFGFRPIGPTLMGGRIVDLDVDPRDAKTIYAATGSGGLWKTVNRGATWECLFDTHETTSLGDVAVSPSNPDVIWLGTGEANNQRSSYWGDGVYRSTDAGKTWTWLGLKDSHHIGRIVVHPQDENVAYVAAVGHLYSFNEQRGVYRTRDGGQTWEHVLAISPQVGVVDIDIDPKDPNRLLAASYERLRRPWNFDGNGPGSAIYRSTDGGDSWLKAEGLPTGDIGRIGLEFYAENPNIAYATVSNQNLIWDAKSLGPVKRNEDGTVELPLGVTVKFENDAFQIVSIVEGSSAQQARLPSDGVLKRIGSVALSGDGELDSAIAALRPGDRFQVETLQGEESKTFDVTLPAEVQREAGGEIYRSEDGGATWTKVNEEPVGGNPAYYYGQIRVDPSDDQNLYLCGVPLYHSTDGGKTWQSNAAASVHVDHHAVWIHPEDSRTVYLGNDGGFHITDDGGANWDHFFNLPATQFYTVSVDMQQPYHVYGGLQDNGSWGGPSRSRDPEGVRPFDWYRVGGGDGFYVCVDPHDPSVIIAESQFGALFRVHRETGQSKFIRPAQSDPNGLPDRYNWNSPIVQSVHDSRVIYFGGNKLFRSYNYGDNWEVISPDLTTRAVERIAGNVPHCTITTISESTMRSGELLVGTDDGLLQWTRDGGKTWSEVSGKLPFTPDGWWASRVVLSRHQEGRAFASFTGYREDDFRAFLFRTDDYGQSWRDVSGDLPTEPINVVAEDPENESVLYVGTEFGVHVTIDAGASWVRLGDLPRIAVHDLVIHPRDRDLVIGTHAKGFYIVDDITPLHELSAEVMDKDVHLFGVRDSVLWQTKRSDGLSGNRSYVAENPINGVTISYWLKSTLPSDSVTLEIQDQSGKTVAKLESTSGEGLNRVEWLFQQPRGRRGRGGRGGRGPGNPPVQPGDYQAVLKVGDETVLTEPFHVLADPILETLNGPVR